MVVLISDQGRRNTTVSQGDEWLYNSGGIFHQNHLSCPHRSGCDEAQRRPKVEKQTQSVRAQSQNLSWAKSKSGPEDLRLQKFQSWWAEQLGEGLNHQEYVSGAQNVRRHWERGPCLPCLIPSLVTTLVLTTVQGILLSRTLEKPFMLNDLLRFIHLSHSSGFKRPFLSLATYCLG